MVSSSSVNVVAIVGPTASGKSALAMALAKRVAGEIVNADSRQFYRELNIGTAKPGAVEREGVAHHLLDCTSLDAPWDVAQFVRAARVAVEDILAKKKIAIITGGTGLYLRSLLFGLDAIPPIDPHLRSHLRSEHQSFGIAKLYQRLQTLDPMGAKRLQPNDTQRILRALEVVLQTQKPLHEFWQKQNQPQWPCLRFALQVERSDLYQRINARVDMMLRLGLKCEVMELSKRYPNNPVLNKTIGYQEWLKLGFDDDASVRQAIQQNTRHFAKRQLTWFRKETDIVWLPEEKALQEIGDRLLGGL